MTITRSRWTLVTGGLLILGLLAAPHPARAQTDPDRAGFTIGVDLGLGVQHDDALKETSVGLAGLNLGVGGFLSDDMALLFRIAGTNVSHDLGPTGSRFSVSQVSGVAAGTLQYWLSERLHVEAGPGVGFWRIGGSDEAGFGLVAGAGLVLLKGGAHTLQVAARYSPAFTDSGTVNNVGFTVGYQLL